MTKKCNILLFTGLVSCLGCSNGYVIERAETLPQHAMEDLPGVEAPPASNVLIASTAGRDYTKTYLRMRVLPNDASEFLKSRAESLNVPITDWIVIAEVTEEVPDWVLTGELLGGSVSGTHEVPSRKFEDSMDSINEKWSYQESSGELLGRIIKIR